VIGVYLVRHAIAEQRDFVRWPDDAERPLSPVGIARSPHTAWKPAGKGRRPGSSSN
jgi:phosphohistidine phosphatase SixA